MMNYKNLTTAQLLEEKSHMEQIGYPGEVQLLDIMEELAARKAAKQQQPTFIDHLEKTLRTSVYTHRKSKKSISKYGSAIYTPYQTNLKEFTIRAEGVHVYGVFDPTTLELVKVTCPSKRKDNKYYKQWLENDYQYALDAWKDK